MLVSGEDQAVEGPARACSSGSRRRRMLKSARITRTSHPLPSPCVPMLIDFLCSCTVSTTCETRTTLSNIVSHERQCKHAQDELKAAQAEVKRLKALLQPAAAAAGPAPPPKPQASGSAVRFHPHPAAFGLPPPRIKRSAAPSLADEEEPPSKRRSSR